MSKLNCFLMILLFVCLATAACNPGSTRSSGVALFDAQRYFEAEAAKLSTVKTIHKTVTRNGAVSATDVQVSDWKNELEPFRQCNIDKPALLSSYATDTSFAGDTIKIKIRASEPGLAVRSVDITKLKDQTLFLAIETSESNELYSSSRKLSYVPGSSYSITGYQDMKLGKKTTYSIEATWQ